jgi:beta-lactamase regulating signal transducer with metallopeptidase domain
MDMLTFLFESGICAATLWLTYHCLLRREASFALNRFYLLLSMPLSFAIPLLHLPLLPAADVAASAVAELASAPPAKNAGAAERLVEGASLLSTLYFFVAGCLVVRAAVRLYGAYRALVTRRGAVTERCHAFTFFRKIYVNRELVANAPDYENILLHEQAHARQLHSLDLLLAELFAAIQWFNPCAWKLKKSLVEVHEYIADAYAAAHGAGVASYMQLLYRQTVGVHPECANGFNHSLTKKRLSLLSGLENVNWAASLINKGI